MLLSTCVVLISITMAIIYRYLLWQSWHSQWWNLTNFNWPSFCLLGCSMINAFWWMTQNLHILHWFTCAYRQSYTSNVFISDIQVLLLSGSWDWPRHWPLLRNLHTFSPQVTSVSTLSSWLFIISLHIPAYTSLSETWPLHDCSYELGKGHQYKNGAMWVWSTWSCSLLVVLGPV